MGSLTRSSGTHESQTHVLLTYRPLLLLAFLAPTLIFDRLAYWAYLLIFSMIAVATCLSVGDGLLRRLGTVSRPLWIGAGATTAILVLQLAPWAPAALAYPIWHNAAQALGLDLGNTISLDPGATTGTLLGLLFEVMVALIFALAAATKAEAAGLYRAICLGLYLTVGLWTVGRLAHWADATGRSALMSTASCIALVTAGCLIMEAWRRSRTTDAARSDRKQDLGLGAFGLVAALAGLVGTADAAAALLGVAGIAVAAAAARLPNVKFGLRTSLVVAVLATLLVTVLILRPDRVTTYLSAPPTISAGALSAASTGHLLSDVPPLGTGGGTFPLLAELYRQGSQEGAAAPSFAIRLYVEFGPVGTPILLFGWLLLTSALLAGALRRGRDRYFCASATGICLMLMVKAALDTGPADAAIQVVIAGLIGIALAQRMSPDR